MRGLPQADQDELVHKLGYDPTSRQTVLLSQFLSQSLTRQLTSFPVDLRVEREIASDLPDHAKLQTAYLAVQVTDFLPTLNEAMLAVLPKRVYQASTAMNLVFGDVAAELTGIKSDPLYREHPSRPLAKQLSRHLELVTEPGHAGDRRLTDVWAHELGLRDWYDWVNYPEE